MLARTNTRCILDKPQTCLKKQDHFSLQLEKNDHQISSQKNGIEISD